mmetsp:Transcript_17527/g.48623  ORF Transcript_17527/g.48623 Transcript_17527/m.48623 type:complete len:240 (-) Transcript_17527:394-1113(-)|eukprot:CAMPEP_0198129300 /NCGR_PEP_ID=MMETSP1442-20131203/51379_1 /TAXON_ID= /ORGANISM="Craspedostauros australis, Strain CCMP3328" /LENGTH=239 /DNA_ID=CAMNT_0043789669 /DNA_START=134 /DNA_END=853 /DNA_ORIENTATION=+
MPKVQKASKLRRVARRVAASEPLVAAKEHGSTLHSQAANTPNSPLTPSSSSTGADHTKRKGDGKPSDEPDVPKTQELSRGQRKRLAKRERFLQKERLILSTLKLKKDEEQSKRIDGLDAIREALVGTVAKGGKESAKQQQQTQSQIVKSNKGKRYLAAKEINHFNLVSQHPAFQSDPFATLQQHLQNTFADQAKRLQQQTETRNREDAKQKEERTQLKKEQLQGRRKKRKKFKAGRSKA